MNPDRVGCSVPFCRRTFKRVHEHEEVICGKHWRLAPKRWRRRVTLFRRRGRVDLVRRGWEQCLRYIIEAAGGIG